MLKPSAGWWSLQQRISTSRSKYGRRVSKSRSWVERSRWGKYMTREVLAAVRAVAKLPCDLLVVYQG